MDYFGIFLHLTGQSDKYEMTYNDWEERFVWYRKTPAVDCLMEEFHALHTKGYHDNLYDDYYATIAQEWRKEADMVL